MKRSLLLSTATRRGLARACLFPSPYALGATESLIFLSASDIRASVSFSIPLSFRRLSLLSLFPLFFRHPLPFLFFSYQKRTKHRLVLSMFTHIFPQLTDSNAMQLGYAGLRYFHNLRNLVHIQFFHII